MSLSHVHARLRRARGAASCGSILLSGRPLVFAGILATALGASHGAFAQTPAAPTGLAVAGGTSQLNLTWTNVTGLTYNIYKWNGGTEPTTPAFTGKTSPFTDTGLTNGSTYYYRVSGVNSSSVEGPQAAAVVAVPIAQPTGVTAKAGNGVVNLSWGAATGALRYNIYRTTGTSGPGTETLLATDISNVCYNDTAVTNGNLYYYKVSGVRKDPLAISATESTLSSEVSVTPLASLPAAPSALAAVPGNAQVLLSWGSVSGATGYKLYRSLNKSGGPYTLLTSPTATGYTDTTATNGTAINPRTYYYVVTTITGVGESAYSAEASASPGATGAAGVTLTSVADTAASSSNPTLVYGYHNLIYAINTASNTTVAYVKFDLSGVSGTVTNALLKLDATATASGITASASPVSDTTWTEAALIWNNRPSLGSAIVSSAIPTSETNPTWDVTTYIRAQQLAGQTQISLALTQDVANSIGISIRARESGISPQLILVTSGPSAPSGLTATGGLGQISLTWNAVPGATSYSVKRATATGGPYTTVATGITTPSYINTGLADGTAYFYVVSATNSTGEGANSNEATATTNTVTTPRNLTATPGEQQVLLTWTPVAGQGYNVYRSTTSGSGYTKINTGAIVTPNAYIDTTLTNGTTYYYVVTYVNSSSVESGQSTQSSTAPLAQDVNWTIVKPSGSSSPAPTVTANTASFGSSQGSSMLVSAGVTGSVTSQVTAQAEAACSGTWTFTWTGSSWPTLYVIGHQQSRIYTASVNAGTGTATVSNTGGGTIVSTTYPTNGTSLITNPTFTSTTDTSDLSDITWSNMFATHGSSYLSAPGTTSGVSTGWNEVLANISNIQTAYTSQWFQNHFTTPQNIVLAFNVPPSDVSVNVSLSNSTSGAYATGQANVGDIYSGQ